MTTSPPDTDELRKLRVRVEALARKREEAEARLTGLLAALLPLDDLLANTAHRSKGFAHPGAGRAGQLAVAVQQQTDAAHQMLRAELARHDVHPMDLVGKTPDPVEARVTSFEPDATAPEGTVLRETVPGFRHGTDCLRRADVVLAAPGPAPEQAVPVTDLDREQPVRKAARARRKQPRRTSRAQRLQPLPRNPSKRRRR